MSMMPWRYRYLGNLVFMKKHMTRGFNLIREFDEQGKIIASICVAALPLGKSGVLKSRTATTYHLKDAYRQQQLKEFGVNVVNEPIVVDDNIITSYCPPTAPGVAFELLRNADF